MLGSGTTPYKARAGCGKTTDEKSRRIEDEIVGSATPGQQATMQQSPPSEPCGMIV